MKARRFDLLSAARWATLTGSMLAVQLAACTPPPAAPGASLPFPPVPPPREEAIPKPPVSEEPLVWQPGHWDWNGKDYVWISGKWVPRDGHGTMWMDGYWKRSGSDWIWVPGHWT